MKAQRVRFTNAEGITLSGKLELPLDRKPKYYALFAHCFTCGKDLRSARNLSLALTQKGFAVLRFDFTGLGQSQGDFADTNFSSNVSDLKAAADYLSKEYESPSLLVGHSLGGTAVLRTAAELDSVRAVATIGAPFEPGHVLNLIAEGINEIKEKGVATVDIAGREFKIKSQFVEDLEDRSIEKVLESKSMRHKSILIMHSPQDTTVAVENARFIYEAARHPKSFVSLDGADHLLSSPDDSSYTGGVIAAWAERYLKSLQVEEVSEEMVMTRINEGPFLTEVLAGSHHLLADEPSDVGGDNLGPTPYEFVAAGLGACTAMTIKMYADRKKWPLKEVNVHLNYDNKYAEDVVACAETTTRIGKFDRYIEISGELTDEQRQRLLEIANKCPVHKTLSTGVEVRTRLKSPN